MMIGHCIDPVMADLHTGLGEVGPHSQLLPCIHIRVVCLLEDFLQLFQLERAEGCAVPALLALGLGQLHGVGESRGKRDAQAGQAGARGSLHIRGSVPGTPSAIHW